ncbi:histidinol-phosphatase [Aestuariispira ectoiniformans]|uniref:histidinol-phosphatase n=1 Tax=Aestuariispira ectoiniformans TaxID=2775080 RepID=UPI00223A98DA|nr:histidinol-phosphatase [Aestuariispira ectoiniformans]
MVTPVSDDIIALAHKLADTAAPIARSYFRQPLEIIDKADESPVTIADRTAEAEMRKVIEATFPDHGIYGEEHGQVRLDADHVWVLDPIDGTKAFITGMPVFGTLIAVAQEKKPVLGLIEQPITRERWIGGIGHPTTLNGEAVKTRDCGGLKNAAMYITTTDMLETDEERARYQKLKDTVKITRFGGDCYSYGLLAAGHVDLVLESQLQPYDFMALVPVVEGAGGIMSDWQGNPLTLDSGPQVLAAATKEIHEEALALLNG